MNQPPKRGMINQLKARLFKKSRTSTTSPEPGNFVPPKLFPLDDGGNGRQNLNSKPLPTQPDLEDGDVVMQEPDAGLGNEQDKKSRQEHAPPVNGDAGQGTTNTETGQDANDNTGLSEDDIPVTDKDGDDIVDDEASDDDIYDFGSPYMGGGSLLGLGIDISSANQSAEALGDDARTSSPQHITGATSNDAKSARDDIKIIDVDPSDLLQSINGMYRMLDLVSEQGSGGFVGKVIIAQGSLRHLINALSPGAHGASLTHIDFKSLDNLSIKPIGIYGSKEEIARFLVTIGVIDENISKSLCVRKTEPFQPSLRSGIYAVRSDSMVAEETRLYIVYWPEDTTWDDNAISSVCRNRVTFMRYLTKVTDQVVALISSEHAKAMVWKTEPENSSAPENEEYDRLFSFEVEKKNEQEENVIARPGFSVSTPVIDVCEPPADSGINRDALKPRLLPGETVQGFRTLKYIPPSTRMERLYGTMNSVRLRSLISDNSLRLGKDLDDNAIGELIVCALQRRFPVPSNTWRRYHQASKRRREAEIQQNMRQMFKKVIDEEHQMKATLVHPLLAEVLDIYPVLSAESLGVEDILQDSAEVSFADMVVMFPTLDDAFKEELRLGKLDVISDNVYNDLKHRTICVNVLLESEKEIGKEDRELLIHSIHSAKDWRNTVRKLFKDQEQKSIFSSITTSIREWMTGEVSIEDEVKKRAFDARDPNFIMSLNGVVADEPLLQPMVEQVIQAAQSHLRKAIKMLLERATHRCQAVRQSAFENQIRRLAAHNEAERNKVKRLEFIQEIERHSSAGTTSGSLVIDSLEVFKPHSHYYVGGKEYQVIGYQEIHLDSALECKVHMLEMSEEDRHDLRLDPSFIPSPRIEQRRSYSFQLPLDHTILHVQLLANERCLLVVGEPSGDVAIYCERLSSIDGAIGNRKFKKRLRHDKIGQNYLLTFDEITRMLAVCTSQKKQLNVLVFDENFTSLQAQGSAVNLEPWYSDSGVIIQLACFVCGSEEILLVDSSAQARIFSLITQQFRPACLTFEQVPSSIYSSPDGSCLFILTVEKGLPCVRAYHWNTFGSSEGIPLNVDISIDCPNILTSLSDRRAIHFISLDVDACRCRSVALDIQGKITEYMFKEAGSEETSASGSSTFHNSLVDCHADVWTRFPVVPAIRRQTVTMSSRRVPKSLTFVTDVDHDEFAPHFSDLISSFQKNSKKPIGEELESIRVQAVSFETLVSEMTTKTSLTITCLRAGEWFVDLLCLIPIQLAITRENRFIPLKDGVFSPEWEKSLLGAEVGQIVSNLSFGWYESLFQSYMVSKPVRVVSSMGEQSVGKSYALNHLVDTSFAGSAMRTTEGVWMSVTPTEDALIVALDFEGVHSIERSAQEDTLLVLFNTAISNLVLFRNNFALSRDITGLFQSFQSSSTVLDPTANPSLFRSTLIIIIKDVVDSDNKDIAREFSLKFQQIVRDEQDANFISKLHGGKLDIIPWPVIESERFYTLFPVLKRRLWEQQVTHTAAGEFLLTLKTLMAKLKANDWGALSQTLAAHRAQRLLSMLPTALAYGLSEVEPDPEPLKNFDTDEIIDIADTPARFALNGKTTQPPEALLRALQKTWSGRRSRQDTPDHQWTGRLASHLDKLVELRIEHVRAWITCNLARFKTSHENIEALHRSFESAAVDLKESVQLCKMQCHECHLLCIRSRHHDGIHNCQTLHKCIRHCDFADEHKPGQRPCGLNAGHPGIHICDVNAHLCGKPCQLNQKPGCMGRCMKAVGHAERDHMCSAPVHACGEPCDLKEIKLADGERYVCNRTCAIPSEKDHINHACDSRMCPITCQLCKRLCSSENHLHGLAAEAVHLCGEKHSCSALCSAQGICEIETAPHSIEATFTGKHTTFQYTKYTQVARRRQCVVSIPANSLSHSGDHLHSTEGTPFHFCETRCQDCGYFCVLPKGHTQQEHETSHGSMSKTRWVVDGPDGTFELDGRKFATNDDGAPMMCNIVCQTMGRHAHIDYCRAMVGARCSGADIQHINDRIVPNPDRAKDWITHGLYWRRSGFKDPYSREDQVNFAKCDVMCGGPEHSATASTPAQPSYCTSPLFHAPQPSGTLPNGGMGYVSNDGHSFSCRNPAVLQQAFHVIFVIDRSGSMAMRDRHPLPGTPVTDLITQRHNNRLGAVYSSLYAFWMSRDAAVNANPGSARRDAYSVILFDDAVITSLSNDFASSPMQLLNMVLSHGSRGGTNYTIALTSAQQIMIQQWNNERTPVVIFLSDGECSIQDGVIRDFCRAAVTRGKPVSFHAVSFGPQVSSAPLRRMAEIAREVQNSAPRDPLIPASAMVQSSYSEALDTIMLAQTFLGIADSLRKTRGSLIR